MVIGGSRRTLVWDDLNPQQRLSVYDRGVDLDRARRATRRRGAPAHVSYRLGDMVAPALPEREALRAMVAEFAAAIREGRAPLTDGRAGLRVLSRARGRRASSLERGAASSARRSAPSVARWSASDERSLRRRARSWSPAAPAPSARRSWTSCSTPAPAEVDVLDNFVRGRRENLAEALAVGPGRRWSRATSATATCVHDLTARHRPGLPPGGDPHHPVRRGAPAGPRGAGRRHLQRARGRGRSTACARWSRRRRPRSTAWPRSSRPRERHHPYNNDTFYGAAKSFNEGMLRSFHAMYGLDYVALRYFNVYGPRMDVHGLYTEVLIRWMERIADGQPPLIFGDGAQTMDFVYTTDIARANILAAASDVTDGRLQHRQRRGDQPARAGRGAAAGDGLRPARSSTARSAR